MNELKRTVIVVLSACALAACSDLIVARPVVLRPAPGPASAELFDRVLGAATARGYELGVVQQSRGRFTARARYRDEHGGYVLAVECYQDGQVSITPIGPRVEREGENLILPSALRDEIAELAAAIENAAGAG